MTPGYALFAVALGILGALCLLAADIIEGRRRRRPPAATEPWVEDDDGWAIGV